jgi:NADPH:quinone reductase-like Zn-dependent oxidoreductase
MKAIVYNHYGSYDQLHLKEVEKPVAGEGQVLVKVVAASINSWDLDLLRGDKWIIRLLSGITKPRYNILGADVAGVVEAIGKNVKDFKPGDEVFGDIADSGFGAFAEYVAVPEALLAKKTSSVTFQQAAALPQAGLLALQGLLHNGDILAGQQILINGAGGGVGTLALQYAKLKGAQVTCVDTAEKLAMLKKLGADHVLDFRQTDYTRTGKQYDKILDVIAHRSVSDYKRALKPNGVFVMIGGSMGWLLFRMMVVEPILSLLRKKKLGIMGYRPNRKDLEMLSQLCVEGKMMPVIDSCYSLPDVPNAFQQFINGKFNGKIVIEVQRASI